ncbi:MAG TPA: folylpolyglutamate synthase/dihydrofolate synthase family protein, partial [Lentimicrobium sp.]|nr:folylpolyglutamate synthase/dihydrofolate synthase family protein [Lentimicrobium sp.]
MNYQEALDFLFSQLPMFHRIGAPAYKANLNNTLALAKITDYPYKDFRSIHIAGTNGKGSVSHMLASIFQEAGYKTGLFTSPHLLDFRERIKVNGEMISIEYLTDFIENHQRDFEVIKPSFFEMTFILGMCYFRDQKVDIAIVETGLGGRLDSTNVIVPELAVITNIGYDHMQFLGNSLKAIATEKAGIIKEEVPVVIGESNPETDEVFTVKAIQSKSPIIFADKILTSSITERLSENRGRSLFVEIDISNLNLHLSNNRKNKKILIESPLTGDYQEKNIKTILACLPFLQDIELSTIVKGIKNTIINTGLSGRWQILGENPSIICDIGHNTHGMEWVARQIKKQQYSKLHFVLGVVNDKDISGMLQLLPKDAEYYFCKADIPRGMESAFLTEKAVEAGLTGNEYGSVNQAYKAALEKAKKEDLIFIGGSAFTVAEVLA